jgi:hypothetical protein
MKKKKQNKPAKTESYISKKTFYIVLIVSVFVGIIMMAVSIMALVIYINTREESYSVNRITYFIKEAVGSLNKETPTASYSNKQFIHEARVEFIESNQVNLVHRYDPPTENNPEVISLADANLIRESSNLVMNQLNVNDALEKVPQLQACSRQYIISFIDKPQEYINEYDLVDQKVLQDNRIAYIWKIKQPSCNGNGNIYTDSKANLFQVLQSIESY